MSQNTRKKIAWTADVVSKGVESAVRLLPHGGERGVIATKAMVAEANCCIICENCSAIGKMACDRYLDVYHFAAAHSETIHPPVNGRVKC